MQLVELVVKSDVLSELGKNKTLLNCTHDCVCVLCQRVSMQFTISSLEGHITTKGENGAKSRRWQQHTQWRLFRLVVTIEAIQNAASKRKPTTVLLSFVIESRDAPNTPFEKNSANLAPFTVHAQQPSFGQRSALKN